MPNPTAPRSTARLTILVLVALVAATGCLGPGDDPQAGGPAASDEGSLASEDPLDPAAGNASNGTGLGPNGTVVHRTGQRPAPTSAYPGDPPRMDQMALPGLAWEPTVGVGPEGTVYFGGVAPVETGPTGKIEDQSRVFRSEDGGHSWTEMSPSVAGRDPRPITLDPYLHVDPGTGRVFLDDLNVACTALEWTDDGGSSWQYNPLACGSTPNDHQTLFTGPPPQGVTTVGYPNVVYLCSSNFAGVADCTRSLDGGRTFGPSTPVFIDGEGGETGLGPCSEDADHGHGATGPDGTAYLPHVMCDVVTVHASTDGGVTWTAHVVNSTVGATDDSAEDHEARVVVDRAGNVHVAWIGPEGQPYLASSTDGGESWIPARTVAAPGIDRARFPSIVAGDDGRVAVSYYGTTDADASPQRWDGYVSFTLGGTGEDPVFATARVTPADDPLRRGSCQGRCGDAAGDFLDLAMDPETGEVWPALVDLCYEDFCPTEEDVSRNQARAAVGHQVGGTTLVENG